VITATSSSIEKGESLIDTGLTLQALGAEVIVVRHPSSGAPNILAQALSIPIINAGDGMHEHPSQALLDAYTILRHKKSLKGLRVVMVGDIYHSRVARSNIHLLTKFGAEVTLSGPEGLLPEIATTLAPVTIERDMDAALEGADVVMMLRMQKERLAGLSLDISDYIRRYQLTRERLQLAREDTIVMHPGPMVRGIEITSEVADGALSVVTEQVANGVFIRMALLERALTAGKSARKRVVTKATKRSASARKSRPRRGKR
jgi:aspartate carbamoyltransferase catalytic subunit